MTNKGGILAEIGRRKRWERDILRDALRGLLRPLAVDIGQNDARTPPGDLLANRLADPRRSPGNDR